MKTRHCLVLLAAITVSLALAGCGNKEPAGSATSTPSDSTSSATESASQVRVLNLTGSDQMKYDKTELEASPGETVRVVLYNPGSLPKAAMAHNFILLKHGVDPAEFDRAAAAAMQSDYFPKDRADDVIAHTRLAGPKEKVEVTFVAPTEPGEYVYLCTFPGHYQQGMHGVLVIK